MATSQNHGTPLRVWGLAIVLGFLPCGAHSSAESGPKICVQVLHVDVGKLVAGEAAAVEFSYSNVGREPLRIEQVIVSCGCLTTSYAKTLNSGEQGILKVNLLSSPL